MIATILYYNGTIDAFGTGFERVFRLCKNIDYQYNNNAFGFAFEFLRDQNEQVITHVESKTEALSEAEKHLYALIESNMNYNRQEMADQLGKSVMSVQRYLKHLTELNLIKRIGANKNGRWIIA